MSALDLSEYVRVKNNGTEDVTARYDGKEYTFKVNQVTDVHHLAASHIFAFGHEDKTNAFHRLGWMDGATYAKAMERLADFEFGEVPSPAVPIQSARKAKPAPAVIPMNAGANQIRVMPDAPKTRISSPTPLADADADEGEAVQAVSPPDASSADEVEAL